MCQAGGLGALLEMLAGDSLTGETTAVRLTHDGRRGGWEGPCGRTTLVAARWERGGGAG